ncbi:hypothetical protein [Bradyrhizobium elkanii]|uniref:hypothetical protein n=1 Tax=Bradyrhizobium elkanii TaxID=29448 RepID=UPI001BA95BCC|nr:hypothetical protein [Bradyrhizobium elkanii]MBR1158087.1 hypothetical protein [Bradyrhizobium elkanii]
MTVVERAGLGAAELLAKRERGGNCCDEGHVCGSLETALAKVVIALHVSDVRWRSSRLVSPKLHPAHRIEDFYTALNILRLELLGDAVQEPAARDVLRRTRMRWPPTIGFTIDGNLHAELP